MRYLKDGTPAAPIAATKKLALQYPPFFTADDGQRCVLPILGEALPWWVDLIHGEVTRIGRLNGEYPLAPPYRIAFDKEIPDVYGGVRADRFTGELVLNLPPLRRKRLRVRYTLYSETTDITNPSYGESVVGWLRVRVRSPRL